MIIKMSLLNSVQNISDSCERLDVIKRNSEEPIRDRETALSGGSSRMENPPRDLFIDFCIAETKTHKKTA